MKKKKTLSQQVEWGHLELQDLARTIRLDPQVKEQAPNMVVWRKQA
jgi:hypothetical protein